MAVSVASKLDEHEGLQVPTKPNYAISNQAISSCIIQTKIATIEQRSICLARYVKVDISISVQTEQCIFVNMSACGNHQR